ncbi:flagellar brake protein [Azohydromonas caseinilytica]|uniref:Flagellar brake protein n=1 Tax=Azohydromonas caseinilytica TaxID=2728836 RepID=A0A848F663_9BURK|nr:flagellar brake protein [Azohydromonas caseinilytica]NML14882.1 flagellar brake protein [Azohydromonas caseinilytica]
MDTSVSPAPPPEAAEVLHVDTAPDIAALLRRLIDEAVPLHLSSPEGGLTTTRLLGCDAERRRIGFAADAAVAQLQPLLAAPQALASGFLDGMQLQFGLDHLLLVHGTAGCTLQAALPTQVLRINRRRNRRVRPAGAPTAYLPDPAHPDAARVLQVLDLSLGGCALRLPYDQPPLHPGEVFAQALLELDCHTRLALTLEVLHVTCMSADSAGLRLGCRFVDPPAATAQALQAYLWRVQGQHAG